MADNAPPSRKPSDDGTMAGMLRTVLKKTLQKTDDMLPAKVISYDRATNRAQVQPIMMIVTTDNELISRPAVASIPVYEAGAGGWFTSYPINAGDLGWIKANDRDISLFLQSGSEAEPNTERLHSFEDAVFIPDSMRRFAIAGDDMVIGNEDGSVQITMGATGITITAPTITINGNIVALGTITSNGKDISNTHKHSGVTTGSGQTGGVV